MPQLPDRALPAVFRDADATAIAAQRRFFAAMAAILGATVLATVFGVVEHAWAGFVAAAAFVGSLAGTYALLRFNPERTWYDGRAVAESAKTLAWQYSVGGGDFPRADTDEEEVERRFVAGLVDAARDMRDGDPVPVDPRGQITDDMRRLRASTLEERRAAYLTDRIDNEREWYARKSRFNARRRLEWGIAGAVLQVIGLVGALLKGFEVIHWDLLSIAAALALAVAAWVRSKDYAELATAYAVAAEELADAKASLGRVTDDDDWAVAVKDAESAISREHTRWSARRHRKLEEPKPF